MASSLDRLVWPRWLPESARLPLVAQVTGAVALTALIMGPWWSRVPSRAAQPLAVNVVTPAHAVPLPAAVPQAKPTRDEASRPAHLNLELRHSLASVDLSVTVDGKRVLESTVPGSGKRFGVFGKREERAYARSINLAPGARVVTVRVRSARDKYDQTRTERFDLGAAAVAAMRVTVDKAGLTVVAHHPPKPVEQPAPEPATATSTPPPVPDRVPATPTPGQPVQHADALAELLQSVRSMLIAIAGFVASAATGFIVEAYLRSRRALSFEQRAAEENPKRRRAGFAG